MIIFYHNKYTITEIVSTETGNFSNQINRNIVTALFDFATKFKDEILVWCHESEKDNLNVTEIQHLFHHKKFLFSYNSSNYFDNQLGYIEDSLYIKINKEVNYATWQMSSRVGAIHAMVLNACKDDLKAENNFDYFLNSFAKRAMANGLFCYSQPKLLIHKSALNEVPQSNLYELFKFTKQHYKARWIFLLFFNLMLFEKKFPVLPFLNSLFYKRRKINLEVLNQIPLESNKKLVEHGTLDVLIPTIGRKEYLLNVLNNLAAQTYLPQNVIIIEQNPEDNSQSNLDFIQNQKWPFVVKHHFTHQAGACNARNIGLSLIESEFTFMADDDIVFENNLLEEAIKTFKQTGNEVFLVACHLKSQTIVPQLPLQFPVFGAGHAFVKSSCIKKLKFTMGFEFGFGEDADFGMQLRNKGFDVLYISTQTILHLKAPMGGFRTKPILKWQNDAITPKPSPTVMLYRLLYDTKEQTRNYKSTLFIKNLNSNFFLNPFKYVKTFKQKWNRSVYWANVLNKQQS
ncbi:glycosyltransferase family A protein [Flavobacterium paronense]|uniref:Glycosyltransferase family 2 protein n=1 Tax=Flavobacterium paronense TaxID=1392775 RepID=A0ABV5GAU1_9FLAO|nr:glycosyltransferase family A protein [Flavobacterium paronense]MDN3676723.1 glycosyltransferase family A protein [Flavobacterium paronense]